MQWCAYRRRLAANIPGRSDNSIRKELNSLVNSFQSNNVCFIWHFLDSSFIERYRHWIFHFKKKSFAIHPQMAQPSGKTRTCMDIQAPVSLEQTLKNVWCFEFVFNLIEEILVRWFYRTHSHPTLPGNPLAGHFFGRASDGLACANLP